MAPGFVTLAICMIFNDLYKEDRKCRVSKRLSIHKALAKQQSARTGEDWNVQIHESAGSI